MHIYSSKFLRQTGRCNSCPLGFRCCSFMESMPKSAVYNFSVPHSISPSGILSFSFSTPVTLSLTLGRVATFATSRLPKVVGLTATAAAQWFYSNTSQARMFPLSSCLCLSLRFISFNPEHLLKVHCVQWTITTCFVEKDLCGKQNNWS